MTVDQNVLLADKAILIATENELEDNSPWYTDGTHTFRFIRVPQFLYNMASAHLRSEMRKRKPQPPVIKKSGREMTNKADPFYIEAMQRWKQEWEDLTLEANLSTSMFRGVEVEGGIPPVAQWIDTVLGDFEAIGISKEDAYKTYYHDRDRLHELWFKKFIILKPKAVMLAFAEFQGTMDDDDDEGEGLDDDEDAAFAADLFRS